MTIVRKGLYLIYGLVGLYVSYSSFMRLWDEGTFGNERHIYFLIMIGPYLGFLMLSSGLFLTTGQVLDFLNRKYAVWFSRISFLLALTILVTIYFIYGGTYIWSETIDFFIFSLLFTVLYLPVIIGGQFLRKQNNTTSDNTLNIFGPTNKK